MNDLVKFDSGGGLPQTNQDLIDGLSHVSAGLTGRAGGTPIMKFKNGQFMYGQEEIEPQEGSRWAVNPRSFEHGYICWGEGELLGEAMVPVNQPPPNVNDLQVHPKPWETQISFQMQCLNGEDTGVSVVYKSSAFGFLKMAKGLMDQIVLQLQHDPSKCVPVVELEKSFYHHKKHGKTFEPVLEVKKWISMDGGDDEPSSDDDKPSNPDKGEPGKARRGGKRAPIEPDEAAAEAEATEMREDEADDSTSSENEQPKSRRRRRRAS